MKAVRITEFGGLEAVHAADVESPRPGAGEVLVRVRAAAVNPSDIKNAGGAMKQTTLPRTLGRDYAGTVVEGSDEWNGIDVFGSDAALGYTRDGAQAEYVVVDKASLVIKPEAIGFPSAASVGVAFTAAWTGLEAAKIAWHKDVVAVTGAAGAVGSASVQIARWHGARIIAVVRDEAQAQEVRQYAPGSVIVLSDGDLAQSVQDATNGRGANTVFDTTGALLPQCLDALALGGKAVVIAAPKDGVVALNIRDFYHKQATLIGVDTLGMSTEATTRVLAQLAEAFEIGSLIPPTVITEFPLDQARDAYVAVAQGSAAGKVILIP